MKKRLIAIACLLFAAMLAFFAAAQAEETPDVLLTDAITDAAVLRYIKNNYTVSDDYYMTQEDLEKVDTICLDFAYSSMVSLDGISIFPNLTDLTVLSNSNITSLSLAGLNKLESLVVSDCPVLTTVDFSNNTSIGFRSADMGGNGITSIITNGSLPVQRLNVNNNPLKSLDLSNFAQLQQFYGFSCGLEKLILPQTSTLEVVCCYSNKISSLNLSGCSGLKELDAHANQIAELALPATSNLKEMDLCGNRLTSLVLSGCGDLTNLDCSENRLSEIDITACPNLHIHSSYFGAQGTDVYLKPINVIATADQAAESWNENDTYVKVNGTPLWSPVTKVSAVYSKADKTITFEASATTTGPVDWFWMLIDGSGNPLDEQGGEGLDDGSALRSVWDLTALELTDEELDYVISLLPEAEAIFVIRDYNCGSYTRIKLSGFGPEIMSITLPPIVAAGENASFEVEAEGSGTLTYQWEVSADEGATWSACAADSAKTASLSIKAEGALDGNLYRCVVTDEGGSTTSPEIPLTVTPGILAQPEVLNAAAGDTVAFSITADGAAGLTYQWQMSKDEGETWSNCSGSSARTASISITPTLTYSGRLYRCVVTDKNGASITSEEAALTVHKALKITAQPVDVTADTGTNAKFTVKAAGEGLTYQWKYRKTAESKWAKTTSTGYDTKTLTIPATLTKNGYQYQCIITDQYGASVTSDAVTLTVHTALKITAQPVNATATAGTDAKFTVKATGDGLKYQWQLLKTADGTWARTTATGYNTATITIPATVTKNGYQYRCVITDEYGRDITSEAAVLTVQAALKISTQPVSATAEAGANAKFTVKAAGDGLTYQWQVLKTADGTWAKTSETGSTTAALTIAA
ncbi:MAG: hypothetical protein Q4G19_09330, partial [Clostridia bacterium]|nr:hypothetical protein [Clostridia bacterium]